MASPMNGSLNDDKWMTIDKQDAVDTDGSDYLDLRSFMDVSDHPKRKRDEVKRLKVSVRNVEGMRPCKITRHQELFPPVTTMQLNVATAISRKFIGIKVGDEFSTHEELLERIQRVQEDSNVKLSRDQSTSLGKAHRKIPLRAIKTNPELKFTSIIYTCKFGGKKHIAVGSGKRQRKTLKRGCPARIRFGLTEDCQKLIVKDVVDKHNHEVDKTIYDHLPRQRKLNEEDQKVALQRLGNKEHPLHSLETSGKLVYSSNIDVCLKVSPTRDDISKLVQRLKGIHGSVVLVVEDDGAFKGIFFQDHLMQCVFAAYPDLLLFSVSYKLTELGMPLYFLITVDGNGLSEIVGIYLAATGSEASLRNMMEAFKEHNSNWSQTKVIVTDQERSELNVLGEEFPKAALQLCLFHTLRSFKLEFTKNEMDISSGVRDDMLSLLSNMAHSVTEDDFNKYYHSFLELGAKKAADYFNEHWMPFKNEWVTAYKNKHLNLGVRTNSRSESIKGKIEGVCSHQVTLDTFFTEFLAVLHVLRSERDHDSIVTSMNLTFNQDPELSQDDEFYRALLTPYTFEAVEKQIKLCHQVSLPEDGLYQSSSCGIIQVTPSSCQCTFYMNLKLPCRHIFAIRKRNGMSSYDLALPANRWRSSLYAAIGEVKAGADTVPNHNSSPVATDNPSTVIKSASEKYREALNVTTKLASLVSQVGMAKFDERMAILKGVHQCWEDADESVLAINSGHEDNDD